MVHELLESAKCLSIVGSKDVQEVRGQVVVNDVVCLLALGRRSKILVVRRRARSYSLGSRLTEITVPTNKNVGDKDWPHKTASPSPLYRGAVEDSRWFMADSIPSGLLASLARHRRTHVRQPSPGGFNMLTIQPIVFFPQGSSRVPFILLWSAGYAGKKPWMRRCCNSGRPNLIPRHSFGNSRYSYLSGP